MRVGYHTLHIVTGRRVARSTIIVRPLRGVRSRFSSDWRAFSVQTPVFSLHSRRSWGCGDVGDLDEFARMVANQHASVVSTLPLLATFGPTEFEASPYRPVSRRFWSERWIALDRVDDLARSPSASHLMNETYSPEHRAAWVRDGVVDGAAAFAAKRNVIQAWASTQSDAISHDDGRLQTYVTEHPDVNDYARFRAAGERFGLDFHQWPSTARSGLLRWNDVDPSLVRYHLLAQWIIDEQMTELASNLSQRGQTLELDIPVGVHPYGYDVWRNPEQYVSTMSIGSPPDALGPEGQNWESPPTHPERCRDDAHHQFRRALRFHMRVAGVVRLDHVMGLQRLFWIPQGASAEYGTYVAMPLEELLAVVAIEAQRLGVVVVGEDLGTVEDGLRDAMRREGLRRTYVAQYALSTKKGTLEEPPSGSVASFATHDTATFAGWWSGEDINERVQLGLLDDLSALQMRQIRNDERRALVNALGCSESEEPSVVLNTLHSYLAKSDAGLVMVQLEDLIGEVTSVNLPGTTTERMNWSRLARLSLEELASSTLLAEALAPLNDERGYAISSSGRRVVTIGATPDVTRFSPSDLHLLSEGRHFRLYQHLGCHPMIVDGVAGCYFAVWAPNADRVSVIGEFNDWDGGADPMSPKESSGVWEGFVAGVSELATYKYRLHSRLGGDEFDKTDPFGRMFEPPPATATRVWNSSYEWLDSEWTEARSTYRALEKPMSIYEVHLGSWRRVPEENNRSLTYRELAPLLAQYVLDMGFTHVELLPIMEHPFYGSWGYQTTGYFAPTSRMGTPDDFKFLVDHLHQAGIGVLLDWVPSHFPSDAFALARFDGSFLFEHADPRQRVHPDWQSWTFNYGRNEVRSFLISNACFWMDEFHADGLRLDAVASMLYLDYSRAPGEWIPNRYGGNEDLDAVEFIRQCTTELSEEFPYAVVVAEESTAWPMVTRPASEGGLGFDFKWDLGWMHDTLDYLDRDPVYRPHHQNELTFRALYAGNEHYIVPLSHDEVVHGKGSIVTKMSGDLWQKMANLRLLFGYQYTIPGKKLLFMGAEFAQWSEWNHEASLDWHLLQNVEHQGVLKWVRELNSLHRTTPALYRDDLNGGEFSWVSCDDAQRSILIWTRGSGDDQVLMLANFTPVPRDDYEVRVWSSGLWSVISNSDDLAYGGSGYMSVSGFHTTSADNGAQTLRVTMPPLSIIVLKRKV
jgi:alpha-1,4-glucan:alpha-1,4-glucan 6-glycosyltransferase/4-alpha-glucanotransferase